MSVIPATVLGRLAYCADAFAYHRRATREVMVGDVGVGGSNPIRIQSMTTTLTTDIDATVAQSERLVAAGCEIVRITAPTVDDAKAIGEIRRRLHSRGVRVPLVADIHFSPAAAMEAANHVEKVRINPGNFADSRRFAVREYTDAEYEAELGRIEERFTPLVLKCKSAGIAMRVGTNHGSLSDRIMNRFGDTPLGMVESALEFLRICRKNGYLDVILSMKASNPKVMIQAYRLLVARMDLEDMHFPLHLGVTEAGNDEDGRIKSAVGIGSLLDDGLGDTIRVSLTEEPEAEIPVAQRLAAPYHARSSRVFVSTSIAEPRDPFDYTRRPSDAVAWGNQRVGGRETPRVLRRLEPGPVDIARRAVELASGNRPGSPAPDVVEVALDGPTDLAIARRLVSALAVESPGTAVSFRVGPGSPGPGEWPAAPGLVHWCSNDDPPDELLAAGVPLLLETPVDAGIEMAVDRLLEWSEAARAAGCGPPALALQAADDSSAIRAYRLLAARLHRVGWSNPIHLVAPTYSNPYDRLLRTSVAFGSLLCDGIGDSAEVRGGEDALAIRLCFNVLQAAGARISKTEFVACPSCGRTLFDLQPTTDRIKAKTGHLVGVKLAIMGCIVNGPGEMADADFGYVGGAPGKVNLYVGKECVEKNVPQEDADERLIDLLKAHGRWTEPPT